MNRVPTAGLVPISHRRRLTVGNRFQFIGPGKAAAKLGLTLLTLLAGVTVATVRAADPGEPSTHGLRWIDVTPETAGTTGFTTVSATAALGIPFTNRVSPVIALNNQILENGAGVALGDIDGDGRCDVYLCGSEPDNGLFRNLGGWRFADVTASAGVACSGQFSTGAALADLDGDLDLDLLVNGMGVGTRLFINDGKGRFTERQNTGFSRNQGATSLALADVDGDGDLDVYVATYRVISARSEMPPPRVEARRIEGRLVVSPADRFLGFPLADGNIEIAEKGEPDALYLNEGHGSFRMVPWTGGAFLDHAGQPLSEAPQGWGLSALLRDLNGDGAPDLYVCNDFFRSRDDFWVNDGTGRFRAISPLAWRCMSLSSMAADAADLDRDGHDDLLVVEMLARDHAGRHRQRANAFRPEQNLPLTDPAYQPEEARNTLFLSRGDGTYSEIAYFAGLAATDWSWNAAFVDIDLDGYEDLLVATGNQHDVLDLDAQNALDRASAKGSVRPLDFYPPLPQRPLAFRNRGDLTFEEVSISWGLTESGIAQGMALADLDNDGDLDVVLNRLNQSVLLLRNDCPTPRIGVRLRGASLNTRGIGARLKVLGGPVIQSQQVISGGRYLSCDDTLRVFAARSNEQTLSLEVIWRGGRRSLLRNLLSNRIYEIDEPREDPRAPPSPRPSLSLHPPLFVDVSSLLTHTHSDAAFDDFERQPLLPYRLSRLGPGVTWCDLDLDGWDDLIVGSGKGGRMGIFLNEKGALFAPKSFGSLGDQVAHDQSSLIPWSAGAGPPGLLMGFSTYEDPGNSAPTLGLCLPPEWTLRMTSTSGDSSTGPLAITDIDGDGDLDLFVGGRCLPGRFPALASSRLFLSEAGRLVFDAGHETIFPDLGLVSAAVFTDFDGDGDSDLALACEWGPVRILRNQNGTFKDETTVLGLHRWTGCWKGIAVGDFDEDGRLDLAVSNLGRNSPRQFTAATPWRLYSADFDQTGTFEVVEAYPVASLGGYAPWRALDILEKAVPSWRVRFSTHAALGKATLQQLLGESRSNTSVLEATTMELCIFLNRADHFVVRPLPREAQFAPGFGVSVADFDGDGHEDLFLAQNWFDFDLDTPRAASGQGLCLLGDGTGSFRPMSAVESGIDIPGQQRGAAVADFDRDGRPDLCVAQNQGSTRLFHNREGKPGLRVRLQGPPGNPHGIGARLRITAAGRSFPVREVHAGTGYWSHDAFTPILARPVGTATLHIDWLGSVGLNYSLPADASEVSASISGNLEILQ